MRTKETYTSNCVVRNLETGQAVRPEIVIEIDEATRLIIGAAIMAMPGVPKYGFILAGERQ